MKILLTGGGTGGHFYPLIAVAEEIRTIAAEQKIVTPELIFMSASPYNPALLYEYEIKYVQVDTGKIRRNFSPRNLAMNLVDLFKIFAGSMSALYKMFRIYPDVVFGKGGYASFPALLAALILNIPVVIHESDSKPGKVNGLIGKFAKRIAISYPEAAEHFPRAKRKNRIAWTGNPIRKEIIALGNTEKCHEEFGLDPAVPVVLIVGGSQGAQLINEAMVDALPDLVEVCQIVHQTGEKNIFEVKGRAEVALENSPHKDRYKPYGYLNEVQMAHAYSCADLIISRAGSTIFEIAISGKPSILIPINERISHDQRHNAFNYARRGAAFVIEENNLAPEIVVSEVRKVLESTELQQKMSEAAKGFAKTDAARVIAEALLDIGLSHER
jgi:UDP-N-acetylglucosamine--N-acetylmuramyl-(pentapeptide) pyrophosphoryl-undecaprenol N-acetylglucosamine transferase